MKKRNYGGIKKRKNFIKSLNLALLFSGVVTINAMAFTDDTNIKSLRLSDTVGSDGQTFSKKWELTRNCPKGTYTYNYGYNTFLINEDYVHTKHYAWDHTAAIANDKHSGTATAKSGKWAKAEIPHAGNSVKYGIIY